jgi:signal transduction histidine kinase/ligand-binding sensor domain-containing protein
LLRNSNIFRDADGVWHSGCLRAFVAVALLAPTLCGLDPNSSIAGYIHDKWSADQGFPGGAVNAISQTPDGYLWIGGDQGLVRFDGVSFSRINSTAIQAGPVLGLAVDRDGNMWIRLEKSGLVRYSRGGFEPVIPDTKPDLGFTAMGPGSRGDVLFIRPGDPMRSSGRSLVHMSPWKTHVVITAAETSDGTVWLATRDNGLFALRSGSESQPAGLSDLKTNCLLPGHGSELWVGADRGLVRWDGHIITGAGVPRSLQHAQILALDRDRDGNVWVGAVTGLMRIDPHGVSSAADVREEVNALFEDREGNLWVGGTDGVERFRESLFQTYARDRRSREGGPVYVDASNRTWFGRPDGGLAWLKGTAEGQFTEAGLSDDVVYSIDGGSGDVWIGRQRGGLTRLEEVDGAFTARTWTTADGLASGIVFAVRRSREGDVWAGTLGGGVSRLSKGRITTYTTANGLLSNTVYAIEEGADGAMWFATPNGLESFVQGHWRPFGSQDALPPARVNCLTEDSAGVLWIGTDAGFAVMRSGRVEIPRRLSDTLRENVLGVVDDGQGFLWIATAGRIVRASRADLLEGTQAEYAIREFGPEDGMLAAAGVRRNRSAVADRLGRIWFSLRGGISVVNPTRVNTESAPAIVHIEGVTADGRVLNPELPLLIPARRQRITMDYVGLSLSAPNRVQYRYRLDGFDHNWSEPTVTRQAVYTNLNPGTYRFRVIASNSGGVWNSSEASVGLEIIPAFWQTLWFRLVGVVLSVTVIVAIYRFRLRQMAARLNLRFEERLAERTRIAQELHDTLLQGFLSASMQVHVATDRLPDDSAVKPTLVRALQLMRQVIEEGRNTLRGLRSRDHRSPDLAHAFSQIPQELAAHDVNGKATEFRVIVDGQQRPLRPLLRDEVYRIGREALINAFRHAQASRIEIELSYTSSALRLFVRDDGSGIDQKTLQAGHDGHWGLLGMRERAERIGARLHVLSRVAAGTEVELDIPAQVAYEGRPGLAGWLAKRSRRRNGKQND